MKKLLCIVVSVVLLTLIGCTNEKDTNVNTSKVSDTNSTDADAVAETTPAYVQLWKMDGSAFEVDDLDSAIFSANFFDHATDNQGNEYSFGLELYCESTYYDDGVGASQQCVFPLGGRYSKLDATIALDYLAKDTHLNMLIEIFTDDNEAFSGELSSLSEPEHISIKLEGVQSLKIKQTITRSVGNYLWYGSILIGEPKLF